MITSVLLDVESFTHLVFRASLSNGGRNHVRMSRVLTETVGSVLILFRFNFGTYLFGVHLIQILQSGE
jgi:hypothetical protein